MSPLKRKISQNLGRSFKPKKNGQQSRDTVPLTATVCGSPLSSKKPVHTTLLKKEFFFSFIELFRAVKLNVPLFH